MTWDDPFKFPKNRGGFSGLGRQAAGELDKVDSPYQRKKVPGATAIKKGDFLYVEVDPPKLDDPYLLTSIELRYQGVDLVAALQTPTTRDQYSKTKVWYYQYRTGAVYPLVEEPFRYPNMMYVGDDYLIRASVLNYHLFADDPIEYSGTDRVFGYLTWARPRTPVVQVISSSADNKAGNDISFIDQTLLGDYGGGVYASGWNAAAGGYGFGWLGRHIPESVPERAKYEIRCYYGSTADRKVQHSVVEDNLEVFPAPGWAWAVGRGKIVTTWLKSNSLLASTPISLRVSTDHGATWSQQPTPELLPFIFRYNDGSNIRYNWPDVMDADRACFSPIGGGRIALVMLCSREDRTWTMADIDLAHRPTIPTLMRWKFFISDENGENFVNLPWPLDNGQGVRLSRFAGGTTGIDFSGLHPAVEFVRKGLGGAVLSAGPGSFFMPVGEWPNESPDYAVFDENSVRFLWTTDYGATWGLSERVPPGSISRNPYPFQPLGISSFSIPKVAVARPTVPEKNTGTLFLAGVVPTEDGWAENVFQTTATFSAFTRVAINSIKESTLLPPFGTFPPPGYMPGPIYVGNKQVNSRFPPRVRPGYPEFEKPTT